MFNSGKYKDRFFSICDTERGEEVYQAILTTNFSTSLVKSVSKSVLLCYFCDQITDRNALKTEVINHQGTAVYNETSRDDN